MATSFRPVTSLLLACLLLACLILMPLGPVLGQSDSPGNPERGKVLFNKTWSEIESGDDLTPDGLGPMFNAESCVACHNLGGVGGAGDNSTNVQLLSVLPRQKSNGDFRTDITHLEMMFHNALTLHPGFRQSNTVVLHRSSLAESEFADWQHALLEFRSLKKVDSDSLQGKLLARRIRLLEQEPLYRVRKLDARNRITLQVTRRNSPALFGAGLIDKIPNVAIVELAQRQAQREGPAKGVVSRMKDGSLGKFGWRGQHATLHDFTVEACAMELGLSSSFHSTPVVPFESNSLVSNSNIRNVDMIDREVFDLVAFIASLPSRSRVPLIDPDEQLLAARGEHHFESIGCADCHVKNVGPAKDVFSDFLLHDMGDDLADAAGAIRRMEVQRLGRTKVIVELGNDRLWQTPPLWGVALSAPYLHDGRAGDLATAIRLHAGEAAESADEFRKLDDSDHEALMFFLDVIGSGARATREQPSVAEGGWSSGTSPRGVLAGRGR